MKYDLLRKLLLLAEHEIMSPCPFDRRMVVNSKFVESLGESGLNIINIVGYIPSLLAYHRCIPVASPYIVSQHLPR